VDATSYHPLYERTGATLGGRPCNVTADAAFDAWHIYQTCARHGGIAAIPLNLRGHPPPQRRSDGTPRCPKGLALSPSYIFAHTDGSRAQEFRCPLLHPQPTPQTCDHEQFAKGRGCVKHINIEAGGLMRVLLDRDSTAYKDLYRQRTAAERINAQATALGIERPKVRNSASVRNLNTLTYIVINVQALQRAQAVHARAATPTPMLC
jgi:Transposase DDE domain